jgi:methylated-DNA-protein-cysteine methyltransferase related protein
MANSTQHKKETRQRLAPANLANMGATNANTSLAETFWQWVAAIPPGKVASYGQIARLAGYPSHARYVGTTLRKLPKGSKLPWFRVLRSSGELAFPVGSAAWRQQKQRLEAEGVVVLGSKVRLAQFGWPL